jgi:hypothetical protein
MTTNVPPDVNLLGIDGMRIQNNHHAMKSSSRPPLSAPLILISVAMLMSILSCTSLSKIGESMGISTSQTKPGTITKTHFDRLEGTFDAYGLVIYEGTSKDSDSDKIEIRKLCPEGRETGIYRLSHTYYGKDWRFMKGITVSIDGKIYKFSDPKPTQNVLRSGGVYEALSYSVDEAFLLSIASATKVRFGFYLDPVTVSDEVAAVLPESIKVLLDLKYGQTPPN